MNTLIYYFTGTGNSLAVARELAVRLDADLAAIKSVVSENKIEPKSDCIGIVFPVYNHRIPYIIKRFAERLRVSNSAYTFAVCTYGDNPCISLEYLSKLLSAGGCRLSLGIGVKMPYNYINPSQGFTGVFKPFILREVTDEEQQRLFSEAMQKIDIICEEVQSKKRNHIEVEYQRLEHAIDFLNLRELLQKPVWLKISGCTGKTKLPYMEAIQLMDCAFHCDEQCVRCGICEKVCPVNNIGMTEAGPKWHHQCEQCFACLHWCPRSALQFRSGTTGRRRYHHPSVSLSDMLQDSSFAGKEV
jgi:ferredoxin